MQDWWPLSQQAFETLKNILATELFQISGNAIAPMDIAIFLTALSVTAVAGRVLKRMINTRLSRVDKGPRYTLARLAQYLVWILGLALSLQMLGIELTALMVVAGTLGIGIGFGLQDVVADVVAGLVLLIERPVRVGDFVTTENDVKGRVDSINFRTTRIVTNDNIAVLVPNSDLTGDSVVNWSHRDERVRLRIPVGVAYGSDVEKVEELLLQVAAGADGLLQEPGPAVRFESFGDSSLNFQLQAWTGEPRSHFRVTSDLNFAIDKAFRKHEIEIPFPQRDLHVRSAEGLNPKEAAAASASS